MNDEHKSHHRIIEEIDNAKSKIVVGAIYAHYKNPEKRYRVKEFGTLESNDELCVIYQADYGRKLIFIRPVSEWLEQVEYQGTTRPRFSKIRNT